MLSRQGQGVVTVCRRGWRAGDITPSPLLPSERIHHGGAGLGILKFQSIGFRVQSVLRRPEPCVGRSWPLSSHRVQKVTWWPPLVAVSLLAWRLLADLLSHDSCMFSRAIVIFILSFFYKSYADFMGCPQHTHTEVFARLARRRSGGKGTPLRSARSRLAQTASSFS